MGRLFGTDGVRGIANEKLTCELAMQLGCAAAEVLSGNSRRRSVFVIGMDSRISSDMLALSCAAGLCSNAGLGFVILFKSGKKWRRNLALLAVMFAVGVAAGYAVTGVSLLFA